MKKKITIMAAVMMTFCLNTYAVGDNPEKSPIIRMMDSYDKVKKLEGTMLKMARPILKKTPMAAVIDRIEMLIICHISKEEEEKDITDDVSMALADYMKVSDINEEDSEMSVYIDTPHDDTFSEIIIYFTRPQTSVMVFKGDFTVESMKEVGELSKQQRFKKR